LIIIHAGSYHQSGCQRELKDNKAFPKITFPIYLLFVYQSPAITAQTIKRERPAIKKLASSEMESEMFLPDNRLNNGSSNLLKKIASRYAVAKKSAASVMNCRMIFLRLPPIIFLTPIFF